MSKLKLHKEGDWIRLEGILTKNFLKSLKSLILPPFRVYDSNCWSVHISKEDILMSLINQHYGIENTNNPYLVLFLTPNAPLEVVKASYKALSSLYHPDKGGSTDKMIELNEAFAAIVKKLS